MLFRPLPPSPPDHHHRPSRRFPPARSMLRRTQQEKVRPAVGHTPPPPPPTLKNFDTHPGPSAHLHSALPGADSWDWARSPVSTLQVHCGAETRLPALCHTVCTLLPDQIQYCTRSIHEMRFFFKT